MAEVRTLTRIATAKAEIAAARAAHRLAVQQADRRRSQLALIERERGNISVGNSESEVGVIISRAQALNALVCADDREAARAERSVEAAVERLKSVQSEAEVVRQMAVDLRRKLETVTAQQVVRRQEWENGERLLKNLSASLASTERKLAEMGG